jgi:hypothetical protein
LRSGVRGSLTMMLKNQVLGPWILVEVVPPHSGRYLEIKLEPLIYL